MPSAGGGWREMANRVGEGDGAAPAGGQAEGRGAGPRGPGRLDARRDRGAPRVPRGVTSVRGAWRALGAPHAGQSPLIEFHSLTNTGGLGAEAFPSGGERGLKADRGLPVGIGPRGGPRDPVSKRF